MFAQIGQFQRARAGFFSPQSLMVTCVNLVIHSRFVRAWIEGRRVDQSRPARKIQHDVNRMVSNSPPLSEQFIIAKYRFFPGQRIRMVMTAWLQSLVGKQREHQFVGQTKTHIQSRSTVINYRALFMWPHALPENREQVIVDPRPFGNTIPNV
jgi:hypothetical protein